MAGGGSLSVLERRRRISQGPTGQSRVEIRGHQGPKPLGMFSDWPGHANPQSVSPGALTSTSHSMGPTPRRKYPTVKDAVIFCTDDWEINAKKCSDEEMSKIIELFCCSSSCEPCTRKQLPYKLFPTFQKTRCYKRNKSIDLKESIFFQF